MIADPNAVPALIAAIFGLDPQGVMRIAFCGGNCAASTANFSDPITRFPLDPSALAGQYVYLQIPAFPDGTPSKSSKSFAIFGKRTTKLIFPLCRSFFNFSHC